MQLVLGLDTDRMAPGTKTVQSDRNALPARVGDSIIR